MNDPKRPRGRSERLIEDLQFIMAEASKMDPFKRKKTLGPGPRGRTVSKRKKNRWNCKCADYHCSCTRADGATKEFNVDPAQKKSYNGEYYDSVRSGGDKDK